MCKLQVLYLQQATASGWHLIMQVVCGQSRTARAGEGGGSVVNTWASGTWGGREKRGGWLWVTQLADGCRRLDTSPTPHQLGAPAQSPLPSAEPSPLGQHVSPLSSKQQMYPVSFFAVIVHLSFGLVMFVVGLYFSFELGRAWDHASSTTENDFMRSTFCEEASIFHILLWGPCWAPVLGFVYSQLKSLFSFCFQFSNVNLYRESQRGYISGFRCLLIGIIWSCIINFPKISAMGWYLPVLLWGC